MLGGKGPLARVNPPPRSFPSLELEGLYKQAVNIPAASPTSLKFIELETIPSINQFSPSYGSRSRLQFPL